MASTPRYPTEAALCADFIAEVRKTGKWEAYAETAGWDILLVRLADGFQIGVSAKLRFNAKVVAQALEHSSYEVAHPGPDCRAVLVPIADSGLLSLCRYIGIVVIELRPEPDRGVWYERIQPALPDGSKSWRESWPEWAPVKRCPLPEYVPDCAAGASAPLRLTAWKDRRHQTRHHPRNTTAHARRLQTSRHRPSPLDAGSGRMAAPCR